MTPSRGDRVIHLDKGLATVIDVKVSAGIPQIIVDVGREVWVPASAWAQHLAPLPSRAEMEAWLAGGSTRTRGAASPAAAQPDGHLEASPAAAQRRERVIKSRDVGRIFAALRDQYDSGDRSPDAVATLDTLEAFALPIVAHVLDRPPHALSAELRAAMPAPAPFEVPPPLAPLRDDFEPFHRATLSSTALAGDYDIVPLATRSGSWSAWLWSPPHLEFPVLVAFHDDVVPRAMSLVAASTKVGEPGSEFATVTVRAAEVDDDPLLWNEVYDPIEPGSIARRGWAISNGGDGRYDVWTAREDGEVVCVIAGNPLSDFDLALLRGGDREGAALETLTNWTGGLDEDADRLARAAIDTAGTLDPSPRILAVLQGVAEVVDDNSDVPLDALTLLACIAPDPMPWFTKLVDAFERPNVAFSYRIDRVLATSKHRGPGDLAIARLANKPWSDVRIHKLQALMRGPHPGAEAAVRDLWKTAGRWTRAHMAVLLLRREPTSCEIARSLIELVEKYDRLDASSDPPNSGYGNDWDDVCDAMHEHVTACAACRGEWIAQITHARTNERTRRLTVIAGDVLARLAGPPHTAR